MKRLLTQGKLSAGQKTERPNVINSKYIITPHFSGVIYLIYNINMFKPNPVVIDGNLQLNSISAAILGSMEPNDIIFNSKNSNVMYRGRGIVVKTFINVIFKTIKDMVSKGYNPTHVCIVWDEKLNGKYSKTKILDALQDGSTYKSDRTFVTEEDLKDPTLSEEEKIKIKSKILISKEFLEARTLIKNKLSKYGIKSYSIPGWEADDIDYIWGLETNKLGGQHLHCSADSDWQFHLTNNDILWQLVRGKLYIRTVESVIEKNKIPEGMELMEWASIEAAALGSHNNLLRTVDPSIKRFTKKYRDKLFSGDTSMISDKKRYDAQKETFDITNFSGVDTVKALYKTMLSNKPNSDETEFLEFLIELGVSDKDKYVMKSNYSNLKSYLLNSKLKQV